MTVKELLVKISADTSGFDKGIDAAVSKTRSLKQEKKELQAQMKEEQSTVKRLTAAYDEACKTYGKTSNEAERVAKALDNAKNREKELAVQVAETNSQLKNQQSHMKNTSSQASNAQGNILKLGSLLKSLITGYAGKKIFDITIIDNAKMEQELTSFEVLLQGNVDRAKQLMSELTDFAAKTPLTLPDTTKATKLLLGYGVQVDNVVTVLRRLGDLSQGDAEKLDRVSLAYGQMLAKGKVTGEELRQMVEAQVPMTQALADALGVTTAQLSKMIEKGQVGIPTLNQAIENMTNEGGQFYNMMEKQSQTAAGLFSTLKDNLQIAARDIGTGAFEYLKGKLSDLLAYIKKISDNGTLQQWGQKLGSMLEKIFKIITGVVQQLFELRSVVLMVIGAFAGLKVAMGVFAAMQLAKGIIQAFSAATTAATAAQTGLNAAMWAHPVGIVLGAMGAVVGAIAASVIAYNSAKKSVEEYGQAIDELDNREQTVIQKFQEYQSLMSKSNAFGLNATEKEKLVSVSKELVDTYGLEYSGIDNLTGAYKIGTEAMDKYTEAARRQRNELLRGQTEERNKQIKKDIKGIVNEFTEDESNEILQAVKNKKEQIDKEYSAQKDVLNEMGITYNQFVSQYSPEIDNLLEKVIGKQKILTPQGEKIAMALKSYFFGDDDSLEFSKRELQQSTQDYSQKIRDITRGILDNIKADVNDALTLDGENLLTDILSSYFQGEERITNKEKEQIESHVRNFVSAYGETINTLTQNLQTDQAAVDKGGNVDLYGRLYDDMQQKAGLIQKMADEGVITAEEAQRQINDIKSSITNTLGLSFAQISDGIEDESIKSKFDGMANRFLTLEDKVRDGSMNVSEYMRQMSQNISDLNIDNVFGEMSEEAGEFLGTLSVKLASVTADAVNQFQNGKITCIEFGDAMAATAQAQLNMTKQELSYAESRRDAMQAQAEGRSMTEDEQKAYNALCTDIDAASEKLASQEAAVVGNVAAWEEMRGLNTVFDENAEAMNRFSEYTQQQIQNLSGGAKSQFDLLVGQVTSAFSAMSSETQSAMLATLSETTGMTISTSEQLNAALRSGQISLQDVMGAAAKAMGDVMGQLGNNIAGLLEEAGNLISHFDYSITFHLEKHEGGEFNLGKALLTGFKEGISIPDLTWKISGEGGDSVTNFASKLKDTAASLRNVNISSMISGMGSGVYGRGRSNGGSDSMGSYSGPESSGDKKKSKSKKDNSDQEAEKARKARVDAYKSYIEENERLDERWNKREQEYGRLNDEQWLYNLAQRAERYRWYADDVLKQDYMTAEEQQELRQKYLEKAEDIDLEYYKYYKQMVEKAAKAEKEAYSERLTGSKDWIAREKALGRMSADEEIAAGRRVQEYTLAAIRKVEENSEYSAEQKKDLIEDMWKTYIEYANREIDIERDKLDKIYEMNKENQERTAELIEKSHSDHERWVSLMSGRDDMTVGEQIAAITKWLEGEEAEKAQIWDSYEQVIAQIRERRQAALDSGEYDTEDEYIKGLDKQIAEEEKKRDEAWAAAHQYYEDLETQRYQLYRDFLNQEVEDFVEAERKKVEAKYKAMEEMEAAEDRDKKRAELEEQIKQYEGAVTKEGKEKLKSLKDELDALNKEEAKSQREQEKEQELENLDELEKGMKEQVKLTARLTIDSDDVAKQISDMITQNDTLAKQWADNFTKPFSDYFGNILPKQIKNAFHMPDYSYSFNAGNLGSEKSVVTKIDRSRHIKQDISVKALNPSDMLSTIYNSIGGFMGS